ncbi:hypothetical protein [Roseiconus lacunae]|uniref:hypothetical protein n=1 Tax=Roseiconus lacunae TaxID=2605694 RepID=UPI001E5D3111|nr:hypothetical protein [Roseiconus lacunae]MCD0458604.1 hypothetical protein [Roseiconus lacunae]
MPAEKRHRSGRSYWYLNQRVDNVAKKQYVGPLSNPVIEFGFRHERLANAERKAAQKQAKSAARNWDAAEEVVDRYRKQFQKIIKRWLDYRGYRLYRGSLQRIHKRSKRNRLTMTDMTRDEFDALLTRAESGDEDAQQRLRLAMFNDPDTWLPLGDMTTHVEQKYVSLLTRGNWVAQESLRMSIAELKRLLKIGDDSTICKLAVDEVVINQLHLRYQQRLAATPQATEAERDRIEKRLNVARKRYKDALELLANIKKVRASELELLAEHKIRSEVPA